MKTNEKIQRGLRRGFQDRVQRKVSGGPKRSQERVPRGIPRVTKEEPLMFNDKVTSEAEGQR